MVRYYSHSNFSEFILYVCFSNIPKYNTMRPFGTSCRIASYSEWKILYMLCKDKTGLLHKDTIQAVYDGTLFEHMAMEKALAGKKA